MSKDGLPTLKDGELFGDVLKQPIVVRYHGVDTQTVEGAALVAARAGEVNRFVAKGRQAYSLSGRTHLTVRGQITDGDARYTNQFGNEIVDVQVNTPQPGAQTNPKILHWDFALIEVFLPYATKATLAAWGELSSPRRSVLHEDTVLPSPGYAFNLDPHPENIDRVINVASTVFAATTTDGQYASFLVDLRPVRGVPVVAVDLYAIVSSSGEFVPSPIFAWSSGPGTGDPGDQPYWPPTDIDSGNAYPPGHPSGVTQEEWDATLPAYHFDYGTQRWVWTTAVYETAADGSNWTIFPSPLTPGWEILWAIMTDPNNDYDPGYIGPDPAPSDVLVTLLQAGRTFVQIPYQAPELAYARWEWQSPGAPPPPGSALAHPLLEVLLRPVLTNPLDHLPSAVPGERYGIPKIGTVLIQAATAEHLGGASFNRA